MRSYLSLLISALSLSLAACSTGGGAGPSADLILHHGTVWTADPARPMAEAVAVRGNRIVKVGDSASVLALAGPGTRVIDLAGRFVAPGFNDAHTHLENAADWFFQVRLIDVNDQVTMNARLRDAVARVPAGIWITGGDWGDFASTASGTKPALLEPDLAQIDAISPDHPLSSAAPTAATSRTRRPSRWRASTATTPTRAAAASASRRSRATPRCATAP